MKPTLTLLLLLIACGVNADQITLRWDVGPLPCPSFLHVSQHPLTAANLTNAFYRVNIGTNTQVHVSVPKGRWYFGVTTECEPTLLTVDVGATNATASARAILYERVVELDRHTADEERRLAVATTRRAMRVRTPSRSPIRETPTMGHSRQRALKGEVKP